MLAIAKATLSGRSRRALVSQAPMHGYLASTRHSSARGAWGTSVERSAIEVAPALKLLVVQCGRLACCRWRRSDMGVPRACFGGSAGQSLLQHAALEFADARELD